MNPIHLLAGAIGCYICGFIFGTKTSYGGSIMAAGVILMCIGIAVIAERK